MSTSHLKTVTCRCLCTPESVTFCSISDKADIHCTPRNQSSVFPFLVLFLLDTLKKEKEKKKAPVDFELKLHLIYTVQFGEIEILTLLGLLSQEHGPSFLLILFKFMILSKKKMCVFYKQILFPFR